MDILKIVPLIAIIIVTASCSSLPTEYNKKTSYAVTGTSQTTLGKKASKLLGNKTDQSVVYLVNEGTDAFFARMTLLKLAERSIDVQYFIWHADLIGKLLFNEMIVAADRGVRVRVLLDDISIDEEIETILYAMDQHENIEVNLFNPFASRGFRFADYVTDASRINRRMHNKSFTVDSQVTVVGGRNIGNEYFSADEESNFEDIDVMAIGPVVADVAKQFDIYWNSEVVYPVKAFEHNQATVNDLNRVKKELSEFKQAQLNSKYALDIQDSEMYKLWKSAIPKENLVKRFRGDVNVIYDDPKKSLGKSEKEIVYLKSLMAPYLEKVKNSFELVSPYFVPGDAGTEYLVDLVKKGIKVRVITNSLASTDGVMAQSGYARQRIDLLRGGVEIFELKAHGKTKASRSLRRSGKARSGLHEKSYIFDRKEIFIGSFNFDQRSANINSEVGIVYEIPEMARLIASASFDVMAKYFTYKVELDIEYGKDEYGDDEVTETVVWIETKEGKEYRYTTDPETSGWRRFNEGLFSILPIESQL